MRLSGKAIMEIPKYYDFLQISPNAEPETIHRVYRFLAARLHPDNPETGDANKFFLLKQAYDVLSNPASRARYDQACEKETPPEEPISKSIDFMDNIEGELNRRLAVMALLYIQRRSNPANPEVSLAEVELRMGFPRDYMEFTTWYLVKKGYVTRSDNSAFTLTAEGVDFVETQRTNIPVLNKLLTSGSGPSFATSEPASHSFAPWSPNFIAPAEYHGVERRYKGVERRSPTGDRRGTSSKDRRTP
jgi:hypothetical protein